MIAPDATPPSTPPPQCIAEKGDSQNDLEVETTPGRAEFHGIL